MQVADEWRTVCADLVDGVRLRARSAAQDGSMAIVDTADTELINTLSHLAAEGAGLIGAQYNGAEFIFEVIYALLATTDSSAPRN